VAGHCPAIPFFGPIMPTLAQLRANRANAQLSSGPKTPEGKAKISHNALKTGLTGRTILLPSDDVAAYQSHVERVFQQFSPETDEEKRLSQSIADTLWRLERIPSLEAGIYAIGRRELASQFADEEDETVRKAMIEAQIFLSYRRDLNNLSIQEARLRRLYEKDEAELKRLISKRQQLERQRWNVAIDNYKAAKELGMPFDPAEIGFEFSTEEIIAHERQQVMSGTILDGNYYGFKKRGRFNLPEKAA
jgi:hypothetical protein